MSLKTADVQHFRVYLVALCMSSFVNYLFKYFIHFSLGRCSYSYWIVIILCIFWIQAYVLFHIYVIWMFSPNLWLAISFFFNNGIQRAENTNFDGIHFIIFLNAFGFLCLFSDCWVFDFLKIAIILSQVSYRVFIALLFISPSVLRFDFILCVPWGKRQRFLCVFLCFVLFCFMKAHSPPSPFCLFLLIPCSSSSSSTYRGPIVRVLLVAKTICYLLDYCKIQ